MNIVATDRMPSIIATDRISLFEAIETWIPISIPHYHAYFIIPGGDIDGVNDTFTIGAKQFEVLLNGQNMTFSSTATGFTLSDPPREGDFLWCHVERGGDG